MSSSNTDFFSDITAVVNTAKPHGTTLDGSNDTLSKDVMEEESSKSRAVALMKAFRTTKNCPNLWLPSSPTRLKSLTTSKPLWRDVEQTTHTTIWYQGFPTVKRFYIFRSYQIEGTNWIVNVSRLIQAKLRLRYYSCDAKPVLLSKSYDSEVGDERFSYHIDDKRTFNMIGPDGKNPVVVQTVYKETFIAPGMIFVYIGGQMAPTDIHGMTVFDASFEVGSSFVIGFASATDPDTVHSGKVEIKV
ncbi:hypothetical protein BDP27DRAFT_1431460 [Rhodocollybia butyracea]|uniref:Uncharacterized protein n=1 Tax=Rhodocollybia butyracea TaxID=206335 RepID=A0A9P5PA34_9AGAR|nr:hypothetical protein BDP27DRAFT_1431460 [Rhodocollybia butyracea]